MQRNPTAFPVFLQSVPSWHSSSPHSRRSAPSARLRVSWSPRIRCGRPHRNLRILRTPSSSQGLPGEGAAPAARAATASPIRAGDYERGSDRRWRVQGAPGPGAAVLRDTEGGARTEFLWVNQIKRNTAGGLGGEAAGNRVVRWDLAGNRVLLRLIDYSIVADPSTSIARAVADASNPAIVRAFNVAAFSPAGDPVIDVGPLFLTEVPELSVRGRIGGARIRSEPGVPREGRLVSREHQRRGRSDLHSAPRRRRPRRRRPARTSAAPRHHAWQQRLRSRVVQHGAIAGEADDASPVRRARRLLLTEHLSTTGGRSTARMQRTFITRYRLEKKESGRGRSLSRSKPIVYYVDPATPAQWVPYVKKGIEDWQPAFESAGFRNAIVAREAPEDDPDWSPEDARYSVIRWLPSTTENAPAPTSTIPARARSSRPTSSSITTYRTW